MSLLLCLTALAHAQATAPDRPVVPAAGIATEGGPGALWVNPANLAYDPDRAFGLFAAYDPASTNTQLAATWGMRHFAIGGSTYIAATGDTDFSVDVAAGIPLPWRLGFGTRLSWHLEQSGDNYIGWDLAVSWRPLPWVGVSAIAYNVTTPDREAKAQSGGGLAFRPWGDTLLIGTDVLVSFHDDPTSLVPEELYRATVRVRPAEGLFLRGMADWAPSLGTWSASAGLEVYFGGWGGGLYTTAHDQDFGYTAFVGTDEPGESLARSGRRVASLDLRQVPSYQPEKRLLKRRDASWLQVLELLRRAEVERGTRGVTITLGDEPTSWARYSEVRERIAALEAAGRPVVVYLYGHVTTGAYYAASAASRVLVHPAGGIDLQGPSTELVHLRGVLDLAGLTPQFVRQGAYKSSKEPLTDLYPSGAEVEQQSALLDDLYDELVAALAEGRGVAPEQAVAWVDGGPYTALEAERLGLVDARVYPDQVDLELEEFYQSSVLVTKLLETPQANSPWESPKQIALIYIDSAIVSGPSSRGGLLSPATSGSATIVAALQQAQKSPQVKAVVLRVDSPGGSAFASDEIWRAVTRVQAVGKPVVVSMGGVAASGGYYLSASADAIWAEPNTITGSIGAVAGKISARDLLESLGATVTPLARGRTAGLASPTTPWDPVQEARMQALVDDTYAQFKARVADGRGYDAESVEAVSRGRVWSGRAARDLGLVDELGGLLDAIADARVLAGIRSAHQVEVVTIAPDGQALTPLSPSPLRAAPTSELTAAMSPLIQHALMPLILWGMLEREGVLLLDPTLLEIQAR